MISLQRQKQEDVETKKKRKKRRDFDDIMDKLNREFEYQTRVIHCNTKRR